MADSICPEKNYDTYNENYNKCECDAHKKEFDFLLFRVKEIFMFLLTGINRFILKRLLTGGEGFSHHFEDLRLGDFHKKKSGDYFNLGSDDACPHFML